MTVIHKQTLEHVPYQYFRPGGEVLKLLDVQDQHGDFVLWYEVDTDAPSLARGACEIRVQCVGTGQEVPDHGYTYLGTTQDGLYVWHWYAKRVYSE